VRVDGEVLEKLEMPTSTNISGLESDRRTALPRRRQQRHGQTVRDRGARSRNTIPRPMIGPPQSAQPRNTSTTSCACAPGAWSRHRTARLLLALTRREGGGAVAAAQSAGEDDHLRRRLARRLPVEHRHGDAGAVPGRAWKIAAEQRHTAFAESTSRGIPTPDAAPLWEPKSLFRCASCAATTPR
jgi:hypothetical protein